ncbi:hypothetical protein [Limnospira platensis]|uniref:hypothetical protein n=1 Tax=Limnospira platensis TaxID=118562 RepID=UPI0009DA4322|nr:hypothetical protein N39L_18540 [Arthrospira platensis NIES-39]
MYQVRILPGEFSINPYPDSDSGLLLNPITMPSYSNVTHNLVLAQENNSVNRLITQSTSTT